MCTNIKPKKKLEKGECGWLADLSLKDTNTSAGEPLI
jgi:hypothetical protein